MAPIPEPLRLKQLTDDFDITDLVDLTLSDDIDIKPDGHDGVLSLHQEDEGEYHSDAGSEDESAMSSKPRNISERRINQNTIFESYLIQKSKTITKTSLREEAKESKEQDLSIASILATQQSQTIDDPREYQLELFERAKAENIIAVLDTGSGKTLIAVLLLRHVLDKELEDRGAGLSPRISFFLVPSVALVFQQHSVLDCNLSHKISRVYGGSDGLEKSSWDTRLENDMVIVCTAEILHQSLIHSFVKMEQINLLIFDEAHHAKANHPYAQIIREFYLGTSSLTRRPQIFGMTASPVNAKVDVVIAARELEELLQCKIATFALSDKYRNKAKELVINYPKLSPPFETPLYQELNARFGGMNTFQSLFATSKAVSAEIGRWGSDKYWDLALGDQQAKKAEARVDRKHYSETGRKSIEKLDADKASLQEAIDFVSQHHFRKPINTEHDLSAKVRSLLLILRKFFERPTKSRCIVFVTRRSSARILHLIVKELGGPHLRVGLLTGLISTVGELKMSFRQQVLSLKHFRTGELNCLVATSVAEEGLDIPDCNLVIRFDLYRTMIEYIQSKGRARHPNSKFVDMLENGNMLHRQAFVDARRATEVMRSWCDDLPADRVIGNHDNDHLTADELTGRVFIHPASGAKLTYSASLGVLDLFTSSLIFNKEAIMPRPHYVACVDAGQFVYEVILPETSPVRSAQGRRYRRKIVAKQSAAFQMVIELLKGKFIDQNLLSTYKKKLPAFRNAQLAIHEKKGNRYLVRMKPSLWQQGRDSIPTELYLTVLDVTEDLDRPYQPLGLLTRSPLPDVPQFPLFLNSGRTTRVISIKFTSALKLTLSQVSAMTKFTFRLWKDVNNKVFEMEAEKLSYWVIPILSRVFLLSMERPGDCIDWETLQYVSDHQELKWTPSMPSESLDGKFVIDRDSGGGRFFFGKVEPNLTPLDPVPEGVVRPWGPGGKHRKDILDYSSSLFRKTKEFTRLSWKTDQPVFEAEQISLELNRLVQPAARAKGDAKVTKTYLCAEPLSISALPSTVVVMWLLFPSIIHRIEDYLIALEACQLVELKIAPALALEALTKDSDNSGDHNEEKINFRPGMGNNYERLEFIGDCFLKMATSISLFSQNPNDNEFASHVKRMLMICNKNLFNTAIREEFRFPEYIRSMTFDRATWYPDHLVMTSGKGIEKRGREHDHQLGDKTVADVCESLIGAAFVQYYKPEEPWTPQVWEPAVRTVTKFVDSKDHAMQTWQDYKDAYVLPNYQIGEVTATQKALADRIKEEMGYQFQYPRLLRSAFCHPSYPFSWEMIPSYQRLEFLGDSLLDTACVTHLFYKYADKDPQWLTEHKMAMVANKFLGALCVKLGFHRHLRHSNAAVQGQVLEYVTELQDAMANADSAVDYWIGVKDPPKCLPDIVEAYVGAVFVDSGFDYNEVQKFFDTHMKPFFEDMSIYDTFASNHPTTHLHSMMSISFGCSNYRLMSREMPMDVPGVKPKVMAAVMIHDQIHCDAIYSSSRNAKLAVSKKALELLQGLAPFEFRARFGCDCRPPAAGEPIETNDVGTAV